MKFHKKEQIKEVLDFYAEARNIFTGQKLF